MSELINKAMQGQSDDYQLKGPADPHLQPKKMTIHRGGQTFEQTVYINPDEEKAKEQQGKKQEPQTTEEKIAAKQATAAQAKANRLIVQETKRLVASKLTKEGPGQTLLAIGADKKKVQDLKKLADQGKLAFPKAYKQLPALDLQTARATEVHKAANKLVGRIVDNMEGGKRGSFFAPVLTNLYSKSKLFSDKDQQWVSNLVSKQKNGKAATASDQLTLVYREMKRLEAGMKASPSRQAFAQLHKLATVQRAMRGAVAESIYSNLNVNKNEKVNLVASFAKGTPDSTKSLARLAGKTMSKFIPSAVLQQTSLNLDYEGMGIKKGNKQQKGVINLDRRSTAKTLLKHVGNQIQTNDPNVSRIMTEQRELRSKGNTIDLNKVDPRYPKGQQKNLGSIKQAGLDNNFGDFMSAMSSKQSFSALMKEEPVLAYTGLGVLYGLRPSTPKEPHPPGTVERSLLLQQRLGYKSQVPQIDPKKRKPQA